MPLSLALFGGGVIGALAWPHVFGTNPKYVWFGMIVASMGIAWMYDRLTRGWWRKREEERDERDTKGGS